MARIVYSMMVTLDGFIAGPDGELDWAIPDEELHTFINEQSRQSGGFLYGRRIFELMEAFWPTADQDLSLPEHEREYARIYQQKPITVFSQTLDRVQGNARLVRAVNPQEIRTWKQQPGGDLDLGGASLAASFIRLGLVDEYGLFVHPVVLGKGLPFFPTLDQPLKLRLEETRRFTSGVVYLRYLPAVE